MISVLCTAQPVSVEVKKGASNLTRFLTPDFLVGMAAYAYFGCSSMEKNMPHFVPLLLAAVDSEKYLQCVPLQPIRLWWLSVQLLLCQVGLGCNHVDMSIACVSQLKGGHM